MSDSAFQIFLLKILLKSYVIKEENWKEKFVNDRQVLI